MCGDCWRIAQPALHAVKTYRDGVGIERCTVCSSALRTLADDPLVSLRLVDVEDMLLLLTDVLRKQSADLKASIVAADAWTSLIDRLEKVCGRTAGQLHIAKGDRLL